MRKLSAPTILTLLLALSWFGFLTIGPIAAQQVPQVVAPPQRANWIYRRCEGGELSDLGKEGWEAYAVTVSQQGAVAFWLKQRR